MPKQSQTTGRSPHRITSSATGLFPTGGWGYSWVGDPDRGNDWRQPGGWIYNLLPYLEQQALDDSPSGKSGQPLLDAVTQMMETPLDGLLPNATPGRAVRRLRAYALLQFHTFIVHELARPIMRPTAGRPTAIPHIPRLHAFPPRWPEQRRQAESPAGIAGFRTLASHVNGIVFLGSEVAVADVSDGASYTNLAGDNIFGRTVTATR